MRQLTLGFLGQLRFRLGLWIRVWNADDRAFLTVFGWQQPVSERQLGE